MKHFAIIIPETDFFGYKSIFFPGQLQKLKYINKGGFTKSIVTVRQRSVEGNVFSHVCLSVHKWGESLFLNPLLVQCSCPHPRHAQTSSTWTSLYRDPYGYVQTWSTWTSLHPMDMFKLVDCIAHTVGKRVVSIRLKCLLV